ncbi:hypothetical protein [Calothrix sp. NIES-2098]|uniref:hypothetical protein n=1 Tax=Calothrix sp. NIES-2098 TaxID=1954171 RepID=UPI0030DDC1CB
MARTSFSQELEKFLLIPSNYPKKNLLGIYEDLRRNRAIASNFFEVTWHNVNASPCN